MKTNLQQRLAVALVSDKLADSILAKISSPKSLSKEERDVLEIALADKKAAQEVEKVLEARTNVVLKQEAKQAADEALLADPESEALAEVAAEAATQLSAAQAIKNVLVPMSKETRARITVAVADDKAGLELISKIEG